MSNRNQIEQEVITNKFVSEWIPRFPQIPVKYENRNFTPPVNSTWVAFSIRSGRVAEAAISSIMPRGVGLVYLQIFLPENAGTLLAREMADRLADVFDNWHYVYAATTNYPRGDFWFKRVEVVPTGPRDGWTQWNASVEFKHDEQVIVNQQNGSGGAGTGDMLKADYAYGAGQNNPNLVDHAQYADKAPVQPGVMIQGVYDTNLDSIVDHAALADVVAWTGVTGKPSTFPPDGTAELVAHKGQTMGYAGLDISGKVPLAQLPPMTDAGAVQKAGDTMTGRLTLPAAVLPIAALSATGVTTVDWTQGEVQQVTLNGNAQLSVINWPVNGLGKLTLLIRNTGNFNVTTWPPNTVWAGGVAPIITPGNNARDIFVLMTPNAGGLIYGNTVGQAYQ